MPAIRFRPRRLGHVNLWVSDLERSVRYYEQVCGIELVRREAAIKIAFHSNGNTHHDIGIIETSRGVDRVGRDGRVQIPATRGTTVGLNHFGWEMESEAELVEAFERARDPGMRTADHLISHSIYVGDVDGNGHEFYADALKNWRSIYHLGRDDEVTGEWTPGTPPPVREGLYNVDPPLRRVEAAPIHPKLLVGATVTTSNFDAQSAFFADTAGLTLKTSDGQPGQRRAIFAGALGRADMEVIEVPEGSKVGLAAFTFAAGADMDLEALGRASVEGGGTLPVQREGAHGRYVELHDPDRFTVRFRFDA